MKKEEVSSFKKSLGKRPPYPLGTGPRILGTGGGGVGGGSSSEEGSSSGIGQGLIIWGLQFWEDAPWVRNFLVSTSQVFASVQDEYKRHYPEPVPQKVITSLSRMYRGFLLELCGNLKSDGNLEMAELYSNLDFVWNFCEIMFLSSHPDFPILPYLNDWIRINFDMTADILPTIIESAPELDGEACEQLWNLIYSHAFHGSTVEASRLLTYVKYTAAEDRENSAVLERQITLMAELLEKKPEFNPDLGSVTEFENNFQVWQEECLNRLDNGAFHGNDNFVFLCKILCGDDEALASAVEQRVLNWFEFMVLLLNYKYPSIRPSHLKAYAMKTLEQFGLLDKLESRDMILLQAMDFNIVNVLKEVQEVWNNPWFALHFSDLIFVCGRIPSMEENVDYSLVTPLRNHFILEFGTSIMEHPTLWQMGIYYLDSLPESSGRLVIRECLQRRSPDSEQEAQKLIQVAEKFGFGDEIKGICRQVALYKLKQGGEEQTQNALLWAIKAGDEGLTTRIVDSILFEGDCEIDASLLDSLKNVLCCYGSLQFLHDFCQFRRLMCDENYKEAVQVLCALIKKDLIPKRLAHKILLKNLEVFDDGHNFDIEHVITLMEYTHSVISRDQISPGEWELLNQKLIKLRAFQIVSQFRNSKKDNDEDYMI